MVVGHMQQVKACGICKDTSYPTNRCPMLYDNSAEQVNMAGNMLVPPPTPTPIIWVGGIIQTSTMEGIGSRISFPIDNQGSNHNIHQGLKLPFLTQVHLWKI